VDSDVLKIAIASDLHAHSSDGESPSYLDVRDSENLPNLNPLAGLKHLIAEEGLKADLLLCPGDLGHQANSVGIAYSWKALHSLGLLLEADLVTATAGNHDIDSRYLGDDHSPEHILKGLEPPFPLSDETLADKYWGRAFAIIDQEQYRLVILNSSAYHGNATIVKNFGRIDRQTLGDLEKEFKRRGKKSINILLCHHHPQQHSELGLGEEDYMRQGQLLLDLLGSGNYGDWIVIHGHKHHPKITYAAGGTNSPVIFAAGSLSSKIFLPASSVARNQFYIMTVDAGHFPSMGCVGTVKAWDWAQGTGWIPSGEDSGLPAQFGFGTRSNVNILADEVMTFLGKRAMKWEDLLGKMNSLMFLLPQDMRRLERALAAHNVEIMKKRSIPVQIGKMI